ncbi:hypothetical protein TrRE_jg10866, partial [Triparma retinervis]
GDRTEGWRAALGGGDEHVDVKVLDWKPVKHRLLAETRVSLAKFRPTSGGGLTEVDLEMDMRWGKKGKKGRVRIEIGVVDVERWWRDMERNARDERDKLLEEEDEGGDEESNSACAVS